MQTENVERSIAYPPTAIVLAGGLGTRLRAVVADRPKVLALAAGRPFLNYILNLLAGQGIREVVLCVGYMAEKVKEFAGDGRPWGLHIRYSQEETPLGTGGALRKASAQMESPFFALNGDTLFMVDLNALWLAHCSTQALATVALLPVQDGSARGCVKLDENGKITSFDEKPPAKGIALINGGVYVLESGVLNSLPTGQPASIEREIFPSLAAKGKLAGHVEPAYFVDIGTPESLLAFEQDLIEGVIRL
jgi:NDP-sugar pyrophosphorylase family protein